jgi:5'(3')-deoxyribonucleotidase
MSHIDANNLYDDLVDYLNSRDEDLLDLDYIRMMEILRETKPELINDIDRDFANLAKVEEAQTHE